MEKAARRFAGWVLAIHVMVFVLLVVIVAVASREVYSNARAQALGQVRVRQELLAAQTARGIEAFYRNVIDQLRTQQRADPLNLDVTALVWDQLRGQATHLVTLDARTRAVINVRSEGRDPLPPAIAEQLAQAFPAPAAPAPAAPAAPAAAGRPGVRVLETPAGPTVLAAAPARDRLLVAVVPLRSVESRFLNDLNQPEHMAAMLLDERMRTLSADDKRLIGLDVTAEQPDPRVRDVARDDLRRGERVTREFLRPMTIGRVTLDPSMVTAQPVDLPDGKRWWLIVSSSLSEVDQALGQFLRRSIIGAVLVIAAMTAVLVSTSVQTIRGRLRLERLQHELINRELAQAREIQLAWLPERQESQVRVDVAAVNRPASHISGDFYNWFELHDGRVVIVVGDVTGHGLPAAFLMATTQLLVRMTIDRVGDPGTALREVNRQLCTHVFSGQFVTMLVAVLDPRRNVIEIANAGHPPPLIGSGADFAPLPLEPQLVLAVDQDVEYRTQRFELPPGASLLFYTDGITDVQSPAGDRLYIEGLAKSLYGRFDTATALVAAAMDAVDAFRVGRDATDDLTLVALHLARDPVPTAPATAAPSESPLATPSA